MPDNDTATPAPAQSLQVVMEESDNGFAPRTRKSTSEALTALSPALAHVEANPGKVYTIVKGVTPAKSASLVSLLNEHKSHDWTFGARSTEDGSAIVQAKYDPANRRPVRTIDPAKLAARKAKAAAKKSATAGKARR